MSQVGDVSASILGEGEIDAGFRDRWRDLAELRGNPFLTPEWFDAWTRCGPSSTACVAGVSRANALIGVLPMVIERGDFGRRLRFAGAALGDMFHPAARPEDEEVVAEAAGRALCERRWSSIELRHGLIESDWREALLRGAGAEGARIAYAEEVLPYVDFRGLDWDSFLAAKSRNFRKGLWRLMRRLQERGEVSFRMADHDHLEGDLARFFELHDMRWGTESRFLNERARRFHSRFAASALERGWLRLGSLQLDGRTIASTLGWRIGDRFSEYQRGYDMDLIELGPGKLVMGEMMRSLNEEGVSIYDQLLGDETYKMQTADGFRTARTVRAGRPWRWGAAAIRGERLARRAYSRVPEGLRDAVRARRGASG